MSKNQKKTWTAPVVVDLVREVEVTPMRERELIRDLRPGVKFFYSAWGLCEWCLRDPEGAYGEILAWSFEKRKYFSIDPQQTVYLA